MAPYNSFYQPNESSHDQKSIVTRVQNVVKDFSYSITTTPTSIGENYDFNSIHSAENAINGNQETIAEFSTATVQEATTDIFETTTESQKITDVYSIAETYTKEILLKHHQIEESHSPNTPYIILVGILVFLVVITIIALIIYHKKKSSDPKEVTRVTVIGKTFNKAESQEEQEPLPQQIVYGSNL